MRYRLLAPADADLDEIWPYIAGDNPIAADRMIDRLTEKFVLIARQPGIGRACEELGVGLHRFSTGNYVIFYRPGIKYIDILRVLHGARNIDALLDAD